MKAMTLVAMLLFTSLAMSAQSNTHLVINEDGLFATADASIDGTNLVAQVARGTDAGGQATTFLVYATFVSTPDGFIETFGSGTIPNDSLQGNDPAHVVLDVDTSQLTTVLATTCTFNFVNFTESCVPAPAGLIHLEWRQTKFFTLHNNSDTQEVLAQARINFHELADTASAATNGSFIGLDVNNGGGTVGVNHGTEVEIFRSN